MAKKSEIVEEPTRQRILDLGGGLAIYQVHVDALREQDVNARSMSPAMFQRLTDTVKRDGRLESLPLVALINDKLEVVSGHHRVRAARSAELPTIYAIVDETGLTRDQIAAKQLAHNAIAGVDETQLVAQIYQSIADVDSRLEAFIDPKELDMPVPERVSLPNLDMDIEYRTLLITFLPTQSEKFEKAVDKLLEQADLNRDVLYVADLELFEKWNALMRRLRKEYDAKAISSAISRFIDAAGVLMGFSTATAESIDPHEWVSLTSIFGTALVPPETANVIRDAVNSLIAQGIGTNKQKYLTLQHMAEREVGNSDGE